MDKVNKFMMPSDFKTSTIEYFNQFNQSHPLMKISETYGQISINNLFPSARIIKETIAVNKKDFERYIWVSLQNHIAFNYTWSAIIFIDS